MRFFGAGFSPEQLEQLRDFARRAGMDSRDVIPNRVYRNDTYEVWVWDSHSDLPPEMHWLSIKRCDKTPIHDWRELQAIKNAIIGREHEAVELYPAESRLVDTANQYHLFVLKERGRRMPMGFQNRAVMGTSEAATMVDHATGRAAVQRELTEIDVPATSMIDVQNAYEQLRQLSAELCSAYEAGDNTRFEIEAIRGFLAANTKEADA